jgi:hypothetical protein
MVGVREPRRHSMASPPTYRIGRNFGGVDRRNPGSWLLRVLRFSFR